MTRNRALVVTALVAAFAAGGGMRAQMPPIAAMKGEVGLGLLLRQLKTTAVLMQAVAHPDDENNGMLAATGWGQGVRTVVVSATRGDGGQNEIGPELFDALAITRTEELISVHQLDSPEQYFTRAVDFGYSFSVDETFEKWGRQEILGDYVRQIRTISPDIIIAMRPDGTGGGQHHQASAVISREAFLAAGNPAMFPEQIREGLRPVAAEEVLLHRPLRVRGRTAAALGRDTDYGRHGRVRPAPGRVVCRDWQPRAQQSQNTGHGAVAVAAGPLERRIPARRERDSRAEGERRRVALRRHRHERARPGALRAGRGARGADVRSRGHRRRGDGGGAALGVGRTGGRGGAACRGVAGGACACDRSSRRARLPFPTTRASRSTAVSASRNGSSSTPCSLRAASGSRRSRMTGWSWRARR